MNWNEEAEKIASWMKQYAGRFNIPGYVVGLSGGIDSAVTACLAVEAVGKENVVGVAMPCDSSPDALVDAESLAENLGIELRVVNLEKSYDAIVEEIVETDRLTQANIKARLRMTALYAVANKINYLVSGTGNKSELMVGYFTKFGDGGVDMEPLGNYYKTEVYQLAKIFIDIIPRNTVKKAPSADLWDSQTDEEELGMTYLKLDLILKEGIPSPAPPKEFEKVMDMIMKAKHKNNPPPKYERS